MNALSLLFFLAVSAWPQVPGVGESVISIEKFETCGFISRFSPNKLTPECFQSLNNAVIDQDRSLLRRNGYATYNATPCTGSQPVRGMWPFYATDGSQYLVLQSSGSMFSSKGDGLCTAIPGLSGLSLTAQMSCVQALGFLWCSDGIDSVFRTNVVSTSVVTQAPLGKYIGTFRNRILLGGVNSALTNLYLSGELDGLDWTLPTVQYTTSPAIIRINGTNDGLAISCLMGEFQNNFYVGRNYDLYGLSGYDLRDFAVRKVSEQIGCMDNNSVKEVNNVLTWLSHRGIEGLSGTQINWLSYPIDPTIRTIITAAGNTQGFAVNGGNFATGNLKASGNGAPVSATISPGNLVVSTWGVADTFNFDTLNNVDTTTIPGSVVLEHSTATAKLLEDFEGYSVGATVSTPWINEGPITGWTVASFSGSKRAFTDCSSCGEERMSQVVPSTDTYGRWSVDFTLGSSVFFTGDARKLMSYTFLAGGTTEYSIRIYNIVNSGTYAYRLYRGESQVVGSTISMSGGDTATLEVVRTSSGSFILLANGVNKATAYDPFNITTTKIILSVYVGAGGEGTFYIDNIKLPQFSTSGQVLSVVYDTALSTPTWGPIVASTNAPVGTSAVFRTQVSSTFAGPLDAAVISTVGVKIASAQKEFLKYTLTLSGTTDASPQVAGPVGLSANTTAYYITPCVTAAGITSWNTLTVDAVNNGGSFSFWISTGSSCAEVINPNTNWNAQVPNSIISAATSVFSAARVLFSVNSATQTPILNDIIFSWNAGSSRPPVASSNYQNKYWMFYTTSTAVGAANDHAVIYDQNQHWQLDDDIPAASAALYLNSLYIGDSGATGTVYLFDTGQSDNGRDYNFSFQTPDLDGDDPVSLKQFDRAYLLMSAPATTIQSSSMTCTYSLDGSSVTYPLGTVGLSEAPGTGGYFVAKLPFPVAQPVTGQWINLACNNTGSQGPIRLYGIRIVYTKTDWP